MSRRIVYFGGAPSPEPETTAYMAALGIADDSTIYFASTSFEITGAEQWTAINDFYVYLKNHYGLTLGVNNLSTVIDAVYPAMGGTASTCKFNCLNPADTDAAFRLSFSGGWTYNGGGLIPNATNSYANAFWNTTANAGTTRISYGGYFRTSPTTGIHGTWDLTNGTRVYDQVGAAGYTVGNLSGIAKTAPLTRFHAVKMDATNTKVINNGSYGYSVGASAYTLISPPFYIGARNNNNASRNNYVDGDIGLYFINGKTMTDANLTALNTAVDALMLALGRNV